MGERIGVIGLGYVGLPLALAFARKFEGTVGFDVDLKKVEQLNSGIDYTGEGLEPELKETSLTVTASPDALKQCSFFVVGVPTQLMVTIGLILVH